jgi:predicted DNA binding CopG/RHH family protein
MRETYDFSNARKNPYSKKLKKSITIRVDEDALDYFKGLAGNIEVPYQTLINMYLKDCASHHRKLELNWK